jgi:NitT/TauT family transport system substrate-binding protein
MKLSYLQGVTAMAGGPPWLRPGESRFSVHMLLTTKGGSNTIRLAVGFSINSGEIAKSEEAKMRYAKFLLLFVITFLLHSYLPAQAQEIKAKIKMSYPAPSVCCIAVFAADKWNIFRKNGLDVQIMRMRSRVANPALLSGDIDYVAGVGPSSVGGTLSGMPTRAVWFASNQLAYALLSQPGIKTIKDLRGKRIGLTARGGTADVSIRIALQAVGENPKDFVFLGLGGRQLLPALTSGAIEAAQFNPPFLFYAKKKGFRELLNVGTHVKMPLGGLTTMVSTLEKRPVEIKRVILSLQQAKDLALESKERTVGLMTEFLKVDKETAEQTYALYKKTASGTGVPTHDGMQRIVKALQLLGRFSGQKIPFEDIANDRYAKEVAKELGYKIQ